MKVLAFFLEKMTQPKAYVRLRQPLSPHSLHM